MDEQALYIDFQSWHKLGLWLRHRKVVLEYQTHFALEISSQESLVSIQKSFS
jgi:hypothetical protein